MTRGADPQPPGLPQEPSRLPTRRIDTAFLRAIEAAARLGSFTAAARELALTQSALSRQIQAVEASIGVPLFERHGPRVRLSAAAEGFVATLRPALNAIDGAVDTLRRERRRPRVRITTFASFASLWLMPRLPEFQARHPDVDIAVEASDRLADLDAADQDVALRLVRLEGPQVSSPGSLTLFQEHIAPVCSPRLLQEFQRRHRPLHAPADLAHTTLIADTGSPGSPATFVRHVQALSWEGWFEAIGRPPVEPMSWIRLNYTHQAVQAALAGMGVAMGQMALIRHLLEDRSLVLPLGPPQPSGYWYQMVHRTGAQARPEVAALLEWLRAELAQ